MSLKILRDGKGSVQMHTHINNHVQIINKMIEVFNSFDQLNKIESLEDVILLINNLEQLIASKVTVKIEGIKLNNTQILNLLALDLTGLKEMRKQLTAYFLPYTLQVITYKNSLVEVDEKKLTALLDDLFSIHLETDEEIQFYNDFVNIIEQLKEFEKNYKVAAKTNGWFVEEKVRQIFTDNRFGTENNPNYTLNNEVLEKLVNSVLNKRRKAGHQSRHKH